MVSPLSSHVNSSLSVYDANWSQTALFHSDHRGSEGDQQRPLTFIMWPGLQWESGQGQFCRWGMSVP